MISIRHRLARCCPSLLAVLIVCLLPAGLPAQTVVFRNECKSPVVVQATTVYRNVLYRDSYLLRSMEATPKIALTVNKILTVHDAKSNRMLFRDVLRATRVELAYGIELGNRPGTVRVAARPADSIKPGTGKPTQQEEPKKGGKKGEGKKGEGKKGEGKKGEGKKGEGKMSSDR
jgi:hypothetical protein